MHPWARPAAQAGVCAARQGNDYFWKLHDYLFDHQNEFTPQNLIGKISGEALRFTGFDSEEFQACLSDPSSAAKVDADVAFGSSHGVRGTPTVFVNAQRVSVSEPEQLLSVIREAKGVAAAISKSTAR